MATVYRSNPDFVLREVAGEKLLIPINEAAKGTSSVISLTETGCFLWKLLEKDSLSKEELSIALREEYAVAQDIASADVSDFVDKAVFCGMIVSS